MATKKKTNKLLILILLIGMGLTSLVLFFVISGGAFLYTYLNIARPYAISGEAMYPNYKDGQYYLTSIYKQGNELNRGDVIIFKAPPSPDRDYIKRVIGLPGEKIMLKDGVVYINGEVLTEEYANGTETLGANFLQEGEEITVPEDEYFVLGDNRPYSSDSREWGFVPEENIISILGTCYKGCE